jgi:hypothetical protein
MEANPTWQGMTAGQFRARFQRRFGDGMTWRDPPAIGSMAQARPQTAPMAATE